MTETRNLNVEKLIKMLNMTTSSNEGEALTALRMANKHLKEQKWTWDELLRGKITVAADPFMSAPIPQARNSGFGFYQQPAPPPPPPPSYQQAFHIPPRPQPQQPIYTRPAPKPKKPKRSDLTLEDLGL